MIAFIISFISLFVSSIPEPVIPESSFLLFYQQRLTPIFVKASLVFLLLFGIRIISPLSRAAIEPITDSNGSGNSSKRAENSLIWTILNSWNFW